MRQVLLSNNGGDRATAYAMSNKIVSVPQGRLCTWIDSQRQNQWALVSDGGEILRSGPLGEPGVDNHCGAALTLVGEKVHAIIGAHHSPLQHYCLDSMASEWQHVASVGEQATYPSVASESNGRLHLAFRSQGDRMTLSYSRFEDGRWSSPSALVVADKEGHIYWTNGVVVGPDDCVHIVFGNTVVQENGALLYGASHMSSSDGGSSWFSGNHELATLPIPAADLPQLVAKDADRIQSVEDQKRFDQPGPRNVNYRQMLLSNPVVDVNGVVHVVLHNGLLGTAELMSYSKGTWSGRPLTVTPLDAGKRIHMQSSLSIGPDDQLHAGLMVEPTEDVVWGANGTSLVRVKMPISGGDRTVEQLTTPDQSCATWLPALERANRTHLLHEPAFLYTRGVNAGGFGNNQNELKTEVFLCMD